MTLNTSMIYATLATLIILLGLDNARLRNDRAALGSMLARNLVVTERIQKRQATIVQIARNYQEAQERREH